MENKNSKYDKSEINKSTYDLLFRDYKQKKKNI